MTVDDLALLCEYGFWADRRLFRTVAQMPVEDFVRTVQGPHGCVRNTLVHALSVQKGWIARCGGPPREAKLDPADYPSPQSVIDACRAFEPHVRSLLGSLRDADVGREVDFVLGDGRSYRMSVGEMLQHAANHGVHHRGQVSLVLRCLGHAPDDFDLLYWFAERRAGRAS